MASPNSSSFGVGGIALQTVWTCVRLPPDINSPGVGKYLVQAKDGPKFNILNYTLPTLELQIVAILFISLTSHQFVLKHFGLPVIISQIIAGLIIGPWAGNFKAIHPTEKSIQVLGPAAAIGYAFFLFQSGVKMDLGMVKKAGKLAVSIGVLSVLIPLLVGTTTLIILEHGGIVYKSKSFFLMVTYSATSFPVVVGLLSDLKIINSELGRLGVSSAIVSDILSLFLFTGAVLLKIGVEVDRKIAVDDLCIVTAFFLLVLFVFRPAMLWIVRKTPEGRPVEDIYIYIVIFMFLITVSLARYFGQFLLFGPFVLGLAVPNGPPLGSALVERFDCMVSGLFLPLFVATCAMRVNFRSISVEYVTNDEVVSTVTLLAKFMVCLWLSLFYKMPTSDAFVVALIMSARGIVEMGWYSFLNDSRLIPDDLFAFMTALIIVLAMIVPMLVKHLYDPSRKYSGYQKRNIMNSKFDSELQILACIHVPKDVTSVINFLYASGPTRECPIAVNVLHLIKLSGQASPLFISHKTQQKTPSDQSYSENVILSFHQFERNNWGAVSINPFTAISPPNLMHEDICTLALDTLTSLIILPFHRRWYIDGSIESDDHTVMTLNCSVLERAPCSVGILIDRGHLRAPVSNESSSESSCNIAMIFFGGYDDREALTFAKRMAQDTKVSLKVLRLYTTSKGDVGTWDDRLDNMVLRDVKDNGYVRYIEEEVNDGDVTASMLRGMVNEYDLIIVGRRYDLEIPQTSGLKQWSEFPELGVIGDLLASADCYGKCSVLIVQQQRTIDNGSLV